MAVWTATATGKPVELSADGQHAYLDVVFTDGTQKQVKTYDLVGNTDASIRQAVNGQVAALQASYDFIALVQKNGLTFP